MGEIRQISIKWFFVDYSKVIDISTRINLPKVFKIKKKRQAKIAKILKKLSKNMGRYEKNIISQRDGTKLEILLCLCPVWRFYLF